MPGFFDTAKPGQPLTNSVPPVLPSANWTTLGNFELQAFRCSIALPARAPCERLHPRRLTTTGASLGVEVNGYSFLPAGLSPAVLPKLACRTQLAWRTTLKLPIMLGTHEEGGAVARSPRRCFGDAACR